MSAHWNPRGEDSGGAARPWLDLALVAILIAIGLWRILPAVSSTPFHRDEARWLANAALLREWRHPLGIAWQDEGYRNQFGTLDESNRRRSQPPVAMYVLGIGVYLQTGKLPGNGYWIMSNDNPWNQSRGNMPPADILQAGRRTDVAIAMMTVAAVYAIGLILSNRVGATAGGLLFALHPLVRDTASRAWSDPALALLAALSAIAGYRFGQRQSMGRALTLGVLLGLGGATKLSPLAVAVAAGGAGLLLLLVQLLWRRPQGEAARIGIGLLSLPAIAFATFVAVYPYTWVDPIDHTRRIFEFRTLSFELQGASFPPALVASRTDAFARVGRELGDRFSVGGLVSGACGMDSLPSLRNLDLVLAIAGWIAIAATVGRRRPPWPTALMAGLVAAQAGVVIVGMGVEYARYLLPVVLAVTVGGGAGIGYGWNLISARKWTNLRAEVVE